MSKHKLEYKDFADSIDIDAFEEAIGFEPLDHRKGEDIGYCPDLWGSHKHGDTTGKFAINRDKCVYHCWVCGGGTLLSLAMEYTKMDEESATEWLHQFARGDTRSDEDFLQDFLNLVERVEEKRAERMPYFNAHVLEQFKAQGEGHIFLKNWCSGRGISYEVMVTHSLGYSSYHKKTAPLRSGEKIDGDYYGPCIVFPHFWDGRLVGGQHRWLNLGVDTPKWLPKYTNTSDFPKSNTVYNFDRAIKHPDDRVVVVESVPTVLFLESMGITAVATFGSSVMESQLRLLRRFHGGVIIAPDNDSPGEKFAIGARDYLERYVDVRVLLPVDLGEGADLGDYIKTDDPVGNLYDHLETANDDDVFGLS